MRQITNVTMFINHTDCDNLAVNSVVLVTSVPVMHVAAKYRMHFSKQVVATRQTERTE